MGSRPMDPDRFQMRELKRRISRVEDQIGYLKTDLKRQTQRSNLLESELAVVFNALRSHGLMVHIEGRGGLSDPPS